MLFMNEYEIDVAAHQFKNHPILGKATHFLSDFCEEVNNHSDGWPYWSLPVRSAAKLITLVQGAQEAARYGGEQGRLDVTEEQLRAAITPIKAFYTRRGNAAGMQFPKIKFEESR